MSSNSATIELPPKLVDVFTGEARYRGALGGRGSGKSFSFAKMCAVRGYAKPLRILCCREIQNSIQDSVHAELTKAIESEPWLAAFYDIGRSYIRGANGTEFLFKGLRHNYNDIKSTSGVNICWVEEAEAVSEQSWRTLIPTIREPGSEIWLTWNPENEDSPTNLRFVIDPPQNAKIVKVNHSDNPWFPEELEQERLNDLRRDPDYYAHVWEGECITRTDAQIFAGKWSVEEFEPDPDTWDGPYFGLDFGFSVDPLACTKSWVHDDCLYIEKECGGQGIELDDTPAVLLAHMPEIGDYTVRADSSEPKSISYLKRNGVPRMVASKKGRDSVDHGIRHMRSFRRIIISPNCVECAKEFRLYSYKIDRLSGDVLPIVVDLHNHYIDSIRYALEPLAGIGLKAPRASEKPRPVKDRWQRQNKPRGSVWTT